MGIASIYFSQKKYEEQIRYAFECLKIAEKIKDTLLIIRSNYDIGSAYNDLRNTAYAKKHFFRAMSFFGETNDKEIDVIRAIVLISWEQFIKISRFPTPPCSITKMHCKYA